MTKTLVFGAGGVGCTYAAFLEKGGCQVTCVCRTNYEAVREKGILIRSKLFGRLQTKPTAVRTVSEAASHGPFDYILVCSKAFPGTSELIRDAVSPQTAIVLAQNGIGIEDEYVERYPENTIISGVVYLPVTQVEPGIIEHGPLERFEIGVYPSSSSPKPREQAEQFASLFTAGGASCPVFSDIQPWRWFKVAINASWNPTTALTRCDDANYLRSSPGAETLTRTIMHEIGRVAAASGYPDIITEELIDKDLERPKGRLETGGKEPSMLVDVNHNRPLEVEAILGNTVRIAKEKGVQVTTLEVVYTLAKALDFGIRRDEREGWKGIARYD